MEIRELDPTDEGEVRRHWEIGRAAADHRVIDEYWAWETAWNSLRFPQASARRVLLGAFDGAQMWGAGFVSLPLTDNLHASFAEFYVHPERRRRGLGRLLVETAVRFATEQGRRSMIVEAYSAPDVDSAGLLFADALGFARALEEGMKTVDLVATAPSWPALGERLPENLDGYRLQTWFDVVPADHLAGFCRLQEAFNDQAPMGELEVEAERWDEERVRERELRGRRAGRRSINSAAFTPDGEMVGLSELVVNENSPHLGYQSGTLVLPGHRGHRLGLAMKLANHHEIRAAFPDCRTLVTGNAGVNEHMNAINELLSFREVERCVEVQRTWSPASADGSS